ncbi:hypothetical protein [uncultured Tateyamaria sp.]|uniref:hypothetical protein n=1 Tax=uncultured Tateyamaria sp. TaxID=455651 RepID=UPI002616F7D5|nr:hypothetical protein [uncultured Tateyamaria sp.]
MKRVIWLIIAGAVTAALFYVSRFWDFRLWSRDGLFGIEALRPQGGLVGQWVRGTDLAPFELLIWAVGAFLVLTALQKLYDLLNPPPE